MGVEITKREYTSIFRPQDTNVNWLLGNTGEWQKLTIEASFGVYIEFDTINTIFVDDPDTLTITNGKSWNDYGFAEGDSIVFQFVHRDLSNPNSPVDSPNIFTPLEIARLEDNKAFLTANGIPLAGFGTPTQIMPVNAGSYNIVRVAVYAIKSPQGLHLRYGHLESSNSQSKSTPTQGHWINYSQTQQR